MKHIRYYITKGQRQFSLTDVMLVTTTLKDPCLHSSQSKQRRLVPAVECIRTSQYYSILLHVFSEGVSNKAYELINLAEAYESRTRRRLPVSALCLDTSPGQPSYVRLCKTFSMALPSLPMVRYTGLLFGSVAVGSTLAAASSPQWPREQRHHKNTRPRDRSQIMYLGASRCIYTRKKTFLSRGMTFTNMPKIHWKAVSM